MDFDTSIDDSENTESIKIEIQIPKKQLQPPPPPPSVPDVHIIHNTVNVTSPPIVQSVIKVPSRTIEPKKEPLIKDSSSMKSGDEPSTLDKVRKHGSQLEKVAVHATQKFFRKGIIVKDSRAS